MIPWETLDTAAVPGGGEMRLMRRGHEFAIRLGPVVLMGSRTGGSEEALARLGCAGLGDRPAPRVLVGGLGMGFTLRAVLGLLGPGASVTVAELVPAVVAWARGPVAALHAGSLDDPRVRIEVADVARLVAAAGMGGAAARYDAILLDVDNGPDGLTRLGNDRLYAAPGLAAAGVALAPGGVLAVWSAAPDRAFARRLREAGFAVDEVEVAARDNGKGPRHTIWFATRR